MPTRQRFPCRHGDCIAKGMPAIYLPLALSNPEWLTPVSAVASAVALVSLVILILNKLGGHH